MIEKPENMNQVWAENGEVVDPGADVIDAGWPTLDSDGQPAPPPHTYMNFIQNKITKFIAHVNEYGIAVWDATTTYTTESWARSPVDNKVYISTTNDNINKEPSANPAEWSEFDLSANVGDVLTSYESTAVMEARGYLSMDGRAVSRTTYTDLFALIGTTFGDGDGSTTFNLPTQISGSVLQFVLERDDFSVNEGDLKVFSDGAMLASTADFAIRMGDTIGKYYSSTTSSAVNLLYPNQPGVCREAFWNFFSDGSVFFQGRVENTSSVENLYVFELKRSNLTMENLTPNSTISRFARGPVSYATPDRSTIGTLSPRSLNSFFSVQQIYSIDTATSTGTEEAEISGSDYEFCETMSEDKRDGNSIYVVSENRSYQFFGRVNSPDAVNSSYFFSYPDNNGDILSGSSCNTPAEIRGLYPQNGNPAFYGEEIYTVLGGNNFTNQILVKVKNNNFQYISPIPDGHLLAGIYEGNVYTYTVGVGIAPKLYKAKLAAENWIKAL